MTALIDPAAFATFALAAAALVAAPGPAQALVLTRTFQGGAREGLLTAAGLEIGTLVHTLAASVGLSAILATSATAFNLIKYLGAGYLVVLGIAAWRKARHIPTHRVDSATTPKPSSHLVLHAAVTGTLNPKVALFFLAFLPQFVNPERGHAFFQFLALGLTFAFLGLLGDSVVAVLGHRAREGLVRSPRWLAWRERLTGAILIGLGIRLAFLSHR